MIKCCWDLIEPYCISNRTDDLQWDTCVFAFVLDRWQITKKKQKQTSVTFLFFNTFDTYNKKRKNVPETEHLVFFDGFSFLFLSLSLPFKSKFYIWNQTTKKGEGGRGWEIEMKYVKIIWPSSVIGWALLLILILLLLLLLFSCIYVLGALYFWRNAERIQVSISCGQLQLQDDELCGTEGRNMESSRTSMREKWREQVLW